MVQTTGQDNGATMFMAGRIAIAVVAVVAVLWAMTYAINRFVGDRAMVEQDASPVVALVKKSPAVESLPPEPMATSDQNEPEAPSESVESDHAVPETFSQPSVVVEAEEKLHSSTETVETAPAHSAPAATSAVAAPASEPPVVSQSTSSQATTPHTNQTNQTHQATVKEPATSTHSAQPSPSAPAATNHLPAAAPTPVVRPVGVALVNAIIEPLEYELTERFWGWRPNDIINVTDNVENFQLGVLEVTRRAIVELAQRISRTGSADAFDPNLENAMSWIMTKATDYWFPSPETKYTETLDELRAYKTKLFNGSAYFYTRADNLIPLFEVFEDLLGSCDQNLVKHTEADGTKVGFLTADNYFYYAKGVAHAMTVILEAVQIDFDKTMENRRSSELLHHAIESCHIAAELEPWIVTNSDLDGILANHRANMAAPISHARYYLGQLVITLGI